MLTDKLREGATGPIAKIVFSLIIISFLIAGVGSYLIPKVDFNPVTVDGQSISNAELEQQVRLQKNVLERQLGEQSAKMLNDKAFLKSLRNDVLEKMINDTVVANHIYNSGIIVNDELVKHRIKELPEFQVDGKFNNKQYETVLARAGYTPNQFGEALRGDIAREVYLRTILDGEFALPHEINQQAAIITEQRTIQKIDVDLSSFSENVEVKDADLTAYYDKHKMDYLLPEKYKLSYIFLTASDLKGDVKYTDEDLQKFFNLHSELFTVPEKRVVAHILIGQSDEAEDKIKEIKAKVDKGEDFAALAKQYSQDPASKDDGGVLPAFSLGNMDANFEKIAFALKNIGDVSEPVNTQYGWHIIKLVKIEPAYNQKFDEVKQTVIDHYVEEQSKILFEDKLQIIENTSYENPDSLDITVAKANEGLDGKAASKAVKQETTDYISLDDESLEGVLADDTVKNKISSYAASLVKDLSLAPETDAQVVEDEFLKIVTNSDVVRLGPEALFVFHIDGYKKSHPKPLADVKQELTDAIIKERAQNASVKFVDNVIATINKGDSIETFVKEGKLKVNDEEVLTLAAAQKDPQITIQTFEMPVPKAGNIVAKNFVDYENNPYIIVLKKVENLPLTKDDGRDNFISEQVVTSNAYGDNELLINSARANAEIEYNSDPEYLKMIENQNSDY